MTFVSWYLFYTIITEVKFAIECTNLLKYLGFWNCILWRDGVYECICFFFIYCWMAPCLRSIWGNLFWFAVLLQFVNMSLRMSLRVFVFFAQVTFPNQDNADCKILKWVSFWQEISLVQWHLQNSKVFKIEK